MNTITREFYIAADAAAVHGQVTELSRRAAKKGIATDLQSHVTQEVDSEGHTRYIVTVTFSDLVRLPGGWELVAVADASATDEPMLFHFDDEVEIAGTIDMLRCDHCERRAHRTKVMFIKNEAGETKQVGGSCAKDFLGHDPFWATVLFDSLEAPSEISGRIEYPTNIVIAAAIEANRLGYRKASESGSTKSIVKAMLTGEFHKSAIFKDDRDSLAQAPAATVTVQQVFDWMLEQEGEFGGNLRRIAESKEIGEKALGLAVYAPAGTEKHRVSVAEMDARREAEEAARAGATPCPSGKVQVEGKVLSFRVVENEYGSTLKMRVVTDGGWTVWGTVPASIADKWEEVEEDDGYIFDRLVEGVKAGDRVRFCATVSPSDDDELFGFFKRPTKAEIIERVEVAS